MSADQQGVIQGISDGGVSGTHPDDSPYHMIVSPSTDDQFNLVRLRLIPIACWRVDDIRFQFDSSVVLPDIAEEMRALAVLLKDHPGCPLSVFGHADPVGTDDYNKTLSGRRAIAIYAMLIRDATLWDPLFQVSLGGDKWGDGALQLMFDKVSEDGQWTPGNGSPAVPAGNLPSGLSQNQGQRQQLFLDYMEKVCGPDVKLKKTDFLGQGADAHGKADYQGCSEFNPLLIFSAKKQAEFDQATDKTTRNSANAPNRRVLVLMFRKGSRVDPTKWPCPRATEGKAGCVARMFSDGDQRRGTHLPDKDRKYEDTHDTFACRFFDRLTSRSPCHHFSTPFFKYGLEARDGMPWTDSSILRIVSEDGSQERRYTMSQGAVAAISREFVFSEAREGVRYRAEAIMDALTVQLFGLVEIFRIQDPEDPLNLLPLPDSSDFEEQPAPDAGDPQDFPTDDPVDMGLSTAALAGDWFDILSALQETT